MVVSPHCGQGNFTAPSRGSIMRPHQLQEGIRTVRTSVNIRDRKAKPTSGLYVFVQMFNPEHGCIHVARFPRRRPIDRAISSYFRIGLRGPNATFEFQRDSSRLGLDCLRAGCIGCQSRFLRQISVNFLGIRRWPHDPFWSSPPFCGAIPG